MNFEIGKYYRFKDIPKVKNGMITNKYWQDVVDYGYPMKCEDVYTEDNETFHVRFPGSDHIFIIRERTMDTLEEVVPIEITIPDAMLAEDVEEIW